MWRVASYTANIWCCTLTNRCEAVLLHSLGGMNMLSTRTTEVALTLLTRNCCCRSLTVLTLSPPHCCTGDSAGKHGLLLILHTQLSAIRTHTPHKPLLGVVCAVQSVNATRRDSTYTILLVYQPLWCHCWHAGGQPLPYRIELLLSFNCTPTGSQISQAPNGSSAGDSPIVWRYELYTHAFVHLPSALISTLEHLSLLQ